MGVDDIINEMPEFQSMNSGDGGSEPQTSNGNRSFGGPSLSIQTPGGDTVEATAESLIITLLAINTALLLIIAIKL